MSSTEFRGHVARDAASVTVTAAANDDAHTVTFGTADADDGTEGHQWSLDLGDNTLEITVSDGTTSRTYTITVVKIDVDALSDDATLNSLSVDGAAVDGFAADVHHYTLRVANDVASVTVAATATVAAAEVTISPADADPGTEGHQVALARGLNRVTVAVAATDRWPRPPTGSSSSGSFRRKTSTGSASLGIAWLTCGPTGPRSGSANPPRTPSRPTISPPASAGAAT